MFALKPSNGMFFAASYLPLSTHKEMCFIFKLGRYIVVPIVSEWLGVEDFVHFDSAICNGDVRVTLHCIARDHHSIFEKAFFESLECPLTVGITKWMLHRSFEVSQIGTPILTNAVANSWADYGESDLVAVLSEKLLTIEIRHISTYVSCCWFVGRLRSLRSRLLVDCAQAADIMASVTSTQLRCMRLAGVNDINNEHISELLCRQPHLQELQINSCDSLTTDCLACLQHPLTTLVYRHNYVPPRSDALLPYCASGMVQLGCHTLSDAMVSHLTQNCAASLTSLDLCGSRETTDDVLIKVISHCTALTDIDFSRCTLTNDPVVFALAAHLPSLRKVDQSACDLITDASLTSLFSSCTKLEEVSLSGNRWVSDVSLKLIAVHCRLLHTLDASQLKLTSRVLGAILDRCPKLDTLFLTNYDKREETLSGLLAKGHQLTALDVSDSNAFSDQIMVPLFAHLPKLTNLDMSGCRSIALRTLESAVTHCRLRVLRCDYLRFIVLSSTVDRIIATQATTMRVLRMNQLKISLEDALRLRAGLPRLTDMRALGGNVTVLYDYK